MPINSREYDSKLAAIDFLCGHIIWSNPIVPLLGPGSQGTTQGSRPYFFDMLL